MGRGGVGMLAAFAAISVIVAASVAHPAVAGPGNVVTVSGASISTIEITLDEGRMGAAGASVRSRERTVRFGTNLTPDGTPSDSPDDVAVAVDPSDPSAGACYAWAGSVTVRSNRSYAVTVTAPAANHRLHFLTAEPPDFAACASGTEVGPAMFGEADPAGAWLTGQDETARRAHRFWLGLEVRWMDAPGASIASSTILFAAAPAL